MAPDSREPLAPIGTHHLDLVDIAVLALRVWVLFPVALGLLIWIITPTYWRPMLSSSLGIGMLAAGFVVVAGGFALSEVAGRLMRRGSAGIAAGIAMMIVTFLIQFVTLWIVLLGPAIIILMDTPQPS